MVWCGVGYVIWSGADRSGVVTITLYGLVQTGLVWSDLVRSVLVFGLEQPCLVQSCYGLFQSGLRW